MLGTGLLVLATVCWAKPYVEDILTDDRDDLLGHGTAGAGMAGLGPAWVGTLVSSISRKSVPGPVALRVTAAAVPGPVAPRFAGKSETESLGI